MKKFLSVAVFTLLFFPNVNAQKVNDSLVEYDFKTKMPPAIENATMGKQMVFRIDNINKFLYEVEIVGNQTEYNSVPPMAFSLMSPAPTAEIAVGKEVSETAKNKIGDTGTDSVIILSDLESDLEKKNLKLKGYFLEISDFEGVDSMQSKNIQKLAELAENLESEIEEQNKTINKLKSALNDDYTKIYQSLFARSSELQSSFYSVEAAKTVKNRFIAIAMTDGLTHEEAKSETYKILTEYPFVNNPDLLLSSFNRNYRQFNAEYEQYLVHPVVKNKFKDDHVDLLASVSSLLAEAESFKSIVEMVDYPKLFKEIRDFYRELNNRKNFFVVSDPVQAEKDVINFGIKITPRKDINTLTALETRNFTTTVPIKGGVKIDFSTGLFLTTGLYNRTYKVTSSATDTTKSIISVNDDNNLAQVALGALMHISPRWTNGVKPGFSFGLGLNSGDILNANLFFGGSLILGGHERFIVSTGLSLATVDYLKGIYDIETEIDTASIETELTEKTTRGGWFISFTYNLTNKNKE